MYYYGARYYNPKTALWLSVDPLAEKYPNISPYAYTLNNPIKYIDPDGREPKWIIGKDGKRVTYSINNDGSINWSKNASDDVIRIGNALIRTQEGRERLKDVDNAKHGIHFILSNDTNHNSFGTTIPEYKRNSKTQKYELSKMKIVIYEKKLKDIGKKISETKNELIWDEQALDYGSLYDKNDIDGMISATAAHEIIHATDNKNIEDAKYNAKNRANRDFIARDVESKPEISENKVLKELNQ